MNEYEVRDWLREAIGLMNEEDFEIMRVDTFEEAGVLSYNVGLVLKTVNGEEFQMKIVRSK